MIEDYLRKNEIAYFLTKSYIFYSVFVKFKHKYAQRVTINRISNSGATKIFRVVGKLLLYRKKSMGKMGGNFTNRQKISWFDEGLIT